MPQNNPPRRPTFRRRLMLSATLLAVSVLMLTEVGVFFAARQALRSGTDRALLSIAQLEIAPAVNAPSARLAGGAARRETHTALNLPSGSGYEKFVQIENAQDRVVAQTLNLMQGPPLEQKPTQEARARSGQTVFADVSLGHESLRCVYYPFLNAQGRPLLAIVGVPSQPMHRSLEWLAGLLGLSLLAGGGAAAVGAGRLAENLTRPLIGIARAARIVGEFTLAARIPVLSPDAEIQDVTTVLNHMLAHLEAAFSAQQALAASQSRFVADASHELRSPLSNLRGTVEVALRRPRSDEEYRDTLRVSLTEIERLSRIVADLLTLSRADAGQFHLNLGLCDLSQIARQAISAAAARAESAGVFLHLAAEAPLPVQGDGDRLREVVDNLLDNALRHAPVKTLITVTIGQEDKTGCLTIRDAGEGLAEEEHARVFDRFYRADPSRARQSGGMGLGLAIAKAIVEAHHGEITVRSRPGSGASFTVCIPMAEGNQDR